MPNSNSFWKTFPGILTALGGFLGAIATLLFTLHQIGMFKQENDVPIPSYPKIISFSASKQSIILGQPSVLSWRISGAKNVKLNDKVVGFIDSLTVHPETTTAYNLTAINENGEMVERKLTISVIAPDLSGIWKTNRPGLTYQVTQDGDQFKWLIVGTFVAGPGTIKGRAIEVVTNEGLLPCYCDSIDQTGRATKISCGGLLLFR